MAGLKELMWQPLSLLLMTSSLISLRTSDEREYQVERNIILQSQLIKKMLEDLENVETIPLENISSSTLDIILEYARLHKDDVVPEEPVEKSIEDLTEEDLRLLDIDHKKLFEVIIAANYLDFPSLLDVGCRIVAKRIKGKTVEQIQETFEIPKEHFYSPEERKAMEEEVARFIGPLNN
jgi:S-phase kinase-associated protein 1